MSYEIRPGKGIGPVQIGMLRRDAQAAMRETGEPVESFVRWQGTPPVLAMQENAFQVYFDAADRVEGIEVMGPTSQWQNLGEQPRFEALYRGVDVFRTPASKLVEIVSREARLDPDGEEPGATFDFPSIGLSLWREVEEETPYFETVSVSRAKR